MNLSKAVNKQDERIKVMSKQYVIASFKQSEKLSEIRARLTALFMGYSWDKAQIREYFTELIRVRNQADLDEIYGQYHIG